MMRPKGRFIQKTYILSPITDFPGPAVQALGTFESAGDFSFAQIARFHCLHVIHSGEGVFSVDGKDYRAGKNTLFAFFPSQLVRYGDFPETPWEYTWLNFSGENISNILTKAGITREEPLFDLSNAPAVKTAFKITTEEVKSEPSNPFLPHLAAWRVLHALSRTSPHPKPGESSSRRIYEASKTLIDSHPSQAPSINELSNALGVDRSTIFRAFIRHSGTSPKKYIDDKRFETAKALLDSTGDSIAEIARYCGFDKHHYFTSAFRKRFGKTPTEYRESLNSAAPEDSA